MASPVLAGGPIQLAYGVADVRRAAERWVGDFGAGPFFVRDHIAVTDVLVDGRQGRFDHSSAYGQLGSIMIELVAVHEPTSLATPGLHHVAYGVDDGPAASARLIERGWPEALSAAAGSTRFAFHDARAELGHLVEIYEWTAVAPFYAMVAEAAGGWDGAEPIRVLGPHP